MQDNKLIEIRGLKTHFFTDEGVVKAVDGVDLDIHGGSTLCVVGESGCGKSITARSILRLIDSPGRIVEGSILYRRENGETLDLAGLDPRGRAIKEIRGREISMIFQEPMSSLSPVHTVGSQIMEALVLHLRLPKEEARTRTLALLKRVGIPKAEERFDAYPFQLSGGMRQRVMIAMALSCESRLLIADEPTTALDVTTQAVILDLIRELQQEYNLAVLFITHDLGVVAEIADEVAVMYLGQVVEHGPVDQIFHDSRHPYLQALLRSIPRLGQEGTGRLDSIRGMVPHPFRRPGGCPFHPRCDRALPGRCEVTVPPVTSLGGGRRVSCLLYEEAKI